MRDLDPKVTQRKILSRIGLFLIGASVISFMVFYVIVMLQSQGYSYIDTATIELIQTEPIEEGATTAIVTTDLGEIRMVLYEDYAPGTVSNFIALVESGYYDGCYIFEAKEDVYFAAGASDSVGSTTASEENELVEQELHQNLWPFKGAVCALTTASDGSLWNAVFGNTTYYTGSRFVVVGSMDFTDEEYLEEFLEASEYEPIKNAFLTLGGVPNFSQQMTVFAQVYSGFSVIDQITGLTLAEEDNENGYTPPLEDVCIQSIVIATYSEEDEAINELNAMIAAIPENISEDSTTE